MRVTNGDMACKVLLNIPLGHQSRIPVAADDFGDDETIRLCLKRVGFRIEKSDPNDSFGMFLGCYQTKYVVGVQQFGTRTKFLKTEEFDSVDELKIYWQLD